MAHGGDSITPPESVIYKRAKPRVILLDESLRIIFAEAKACKAICRAGETQCTVSDRLPPSVETVLARAVAALPADAQDEQTATLPPNLLLRISRMSGPGGAYIGVFIEELARREDLGTTAKRFGLTQREVQVLSFILRGFNASEISDELGIAEVTVKDYFKSLLRKTGAKNRADMLAKAMNWEHSPRPD